MFVPEFTTNTFNVSTTSPHNMVQPFARHLARRDSDSDCFSNVRIATYAVLWTKRPNAHHTSPHLRPRSLMLLSSIGNGALLAPMPSSEGQMCWPGESADTGDKTRNKVGAVGSRPGQPEKNGRKRTGPCSTAPSCRSVKTMWAKVMASKSNRAKPRNISLSQRLLRMLSHPLVILHSKPISAIHGLRCALVRYDMQDVQSLLTR